MCDNLLHIKKELGNKFFTMHTWPYFFPTSTMTFKRKFLIKILNEISFSKKKYSKMFFDARAFIYMYFFENNILRSDAYLTMYNQNIKGDTISNYRRKNLDWWKRRYEYHMFINSLFKKKDKLFFINKYYKPELPLNLTKYLLKFANSSIDVSDGLIDDLKKMINRQSLSFHLFENKIPVSNKLSNLIKKQRLNKINLISNGDDYQVLFTADINKARIIQKASKTTGIKITKIGKIVSGKDRSLIFDEKGKQIRAKSKGYIHQF